MKTRKYHGYSRAALQTTNYVWDIVRDGEVLKTFKGTGARDIAHTYCGDYGPKAVVKRRVEQMFGPQRLARQKALANPSSFKAFTVGELARLPVGTVMERDNGLLYVIYKDGGRGNHLSEPWVVLGDPTQPNDPVETHGLGGKLRLAGDASADTIRALGSLAQIEWRGGKRVALVPCPGALTGLIERGTATAAGEQVLVDAVIRRAAVYGKADATYTGEAELGTGFAIVYLHWTGDKAPSVDMGWAR